MLNNSITESKFKKRKKLAMQKNLQCKVIADIKLEKIKKLKRGKKEGDRERERKKETCRNIKFIMVKHAGVKHFNVKHV